MQPLGPGGVSSIFVRMGSAGAPQPESSKQSSEDNKKTRLEKYGGIKTKKCKRN